MRQGSLCDDMNATPSRLVSAVRALGSDAKTPRDAAHEAAHALHCGCRVPWTRDAVHTSVTAFARDPVSAIREEIAARAIEMLVCAALGVEYDPAGPAILAWRETITVVGASPGPDQILAAMREWQTHPGILARAALVLDLARAYRRAV